MKVSIVSIKTQEFIKNNKSNHLVVTLFEYAKTTIINSIMTTSIYLAHKTTKMNTRN